MAWEMAVDGSTYLKHSRSDGLEQNWPSANFQKTDCLHIKQNPRRLLDGGFFFVSDRDYQSSRTTVRVLIGSFIAARRRASRAISSDTPSISNMTRPGFTLQAQ